MSTMSAHMHVAGALALGIAALPFGDIRAQVVTNRAITLGGSSTTFARPDPSGGHPPTSVCMVGCNNVPFQSFTTTIGVTGSYQFNANAGTLSDPFLVLYANSFSPTAPLTNALEADDDNGTGLNSEITRSFNAGDVIIIVVTTFTNGAVGTMTLVIDGAGALTLNEIFGAAGGGIGPTVVVIPVGSLAGSGAAATSVVIGSGRSLVETIAGRLALGARVGTASLGFGQSSIQIAALDKNGAFNVSPDGQIAADQGQGPKVWFAGFGGTNRISDGGTLTSERVGGMFGVDLQVTPKLLVGVSGGYGTSDFRLRGAVNRGDADEILAAVYATLRPFAGDAAPFYVTGLGGYSKTDVDTVRAAAGAAGRQRGEFGIQSAILSAEIGYEARVGPLSVTPFGRVTGTYLWREGYKEQELGASGLLSATVGDSTFGTAQTAIGARLAHSVAVNATKTLSLSGELAWAHDFNTERKVAFTAASGSVRGVASSPSPVADMAQVGAGLRLAFNDADVELFSSYSGRVGAGFQDHFGLLGARFGF